MNILDLIRPDLLDLQPYSSARDEYTGKEGVFLDANENPFETGINRYPDPLQKELKERVAELKSISSDKIFFGNGSDECIDLLFRLFCVSGKDKVVSISPSYGMYKVSAKINQIELKEVLLNEDYSLNCEAINRAAKDAKMIFLCSPNNPTGNAFPKQEIISILKKNSCLVVVDEAYVDFSKEESMLNEIKNYPNLVVLQTFSKAYGLAGLRLGMLFGSQELVGWMNKVKPPYNINQLTQNEALKRLKNVDLVQDQIRFLISERERIEIEFKNYSIIEKIYPSDSNFILVKVKDANEVYNYLVLNKIISRNRTTQPLCENCIRITIGTKGENDLMLEKVKELC
jgi:histidinol-phosphate aminotransferase